MEKIWIIKRGNSKKLCRNEADMIRRAYNPGNEILEYELKSRQTVSDYFKTKERDDQLKEILGDLTQEEINIQNFVTSLSKIVDKDRSKILDTLKKHRGNSKEIKRIIINSKKYLFTLSTDLDWIISILKCHNFSNYNYDSPKWDSIEKRYKAVDSAPEELKKNFKLAKEFLRKKSEKYNTF